MKEETISIDLVYTQKPEEPKFEFLLEKKLAITCQPRVSESGFRRGFPKVPEER
ncbi:hypothetical protein [Microcystis panniformis]|uniref:Uncharacterized protein n=1 Tax=Microcystis panniformis FACHB-1757 TaxID=1638788 RepID=A0A0K1S5D2_9CHRO|nr:hypothetical protein [Microcystis panniformis]AKV69186.1 hypothetical protein VL20_4246 [Microcystis panniformis FACHB-1757]